MKPISIPDLSSRHFNLTFERIMEEAADLTKQFDL
jgi:hypothetical protein